MTKGKLIADVLLRLQQGDPHPDFDLSARQIGLWLDEARAELSRALLKNAAQEPLDEGWLLDSGPLPVRKEGARLFCAVPPVLDVPRDLGLAFVETTQGQPLYRMSQADRRRNPLRFSGPSAERPGYVRRGEQLELFGLRPAFAEQGRILCRYIPLETEWMEDEQRYPVPAFMAAAVTLAAEGLALRQMRAQNLPMYQRQQPAAPDPNQPQE
jgi:hypothetical protein